MEIKMLELIEGAKRAEGLTVIIDVFRAFSLECYLYDAGVLRIYPIGALETAYAMKREMPDALLFGERGGARAEGCDFGNSPAQAAGADLAGKVILHTTSAGTQGIVNAVGATERVTASLVNADAVVRYIRLKRPEKVSIVAMGKAGVTSAGEDLLCAEYIRACLLGDPFDLQKAADALRETAGAHFFDPARQAIYPAEDFFLCTRCNRFPFVLQVLENEKHRLYTAPLMVK